MAITHQLRLIGSLHDAFHLEIREQPVLRGGADRPDHEDERGEQVLAGQRRRPCADRRWRSFAALVAAIPSPGGAVGNLALAILQFALAAYG